MRDEHLCPRTHLCSFLLSSRSQPSPPIVRTKSLLGVVFVIVIVLTVEISLRLWLKQPSTSSVTTMSQIELVIDADNKPDNLLDPKAIVQQCRDANSNSNKLRGVPLVNKSHGAPYAWVKYGWYTTMGEALTQDFVGKAINGNPNAAVRVPRVYLAFRSGDYGYIVMEYIDGSTCDNSDAKLVAAAVQSLIAIRGPTAEPGPVGRGPIRHRFFVEWKSSMTYHSVQELEQHINGVSVSSSSRLVPLSPSLVSG
jgi:hypothetical protein